MTVKLGMTHAQLIDAINSDIGLIKDQGSKIITKEFPASETETSSVQLDTKCQGKDYMFVFMDYGILEPSNYSLSADGLTVNFSPAIPANHKIIIRYFTPGSSFTNYVTDEFQSNLFNYTTNRILEIPQDIKMEIVDGVLILRSGSKVCVPVGFEEDGKTLKFSFIKTTRDLSYTEPLSIVSSTLPIYAYYKNGEIRSLSRRGDNYSGATVPSDTYNGAFYNTTTNKVEQYVNGPLSDISSLPLGLVTSVAKEGNNISAIDQVFNGFGYIGSTIFALPGIKCLVGNGRNPDGSCITKIEESTKVTTYTINANRPNNKIVLYNSKVDVRGSLWFDEQVNMCYNNVAAISAYQPTAILGTFSTETTSPWNITKFNPLGADSLANSNASNFSKAGESYLSSLGMPSNKYIELTLGASGSTYTAPANGWFYFLGRWENATPYLQMRNTTISGLEPRVQTCGASTTGYWGLYMPVRANDIIVINYHDAPVNVRLAFIYAQGDQ